MRDKAKDISIERTDGIAQSSKLVGGDAREWVCEALQGLWIPDAACRQSGCTLLHSVGKDELRGRMLRVTEILQKEDWKLSLSLYSHSHFYRVEKQKKEDIRERLSAGTGRGGEGGGRTGVVPISPYKAVCSS